METVGSVLHLQQKIVRIYLENFHFSPHVHMKFPQEYRMDIARATQRAQVEVQLNGEM
jgi:hypothetical protein